MSLSKVADPAIVLLDPMMVCSEPERLTGILFQRAELEQCVKPSVMTSATQITSALGSNGNPGMAQRPRASVARTSVGMGMREGERERP